jgi:hypothetical protein
MAALSAIAETRWHRRDLLLGWAARTLAGSVAVLAVADILGLVESFQTHQLLGFRIAAGFKLTLDLALIPAFALSSAAFRSQAKRRARKLEVGATLAAAGATVGLVGGAVATATSIAHQFPDAYIAILAWTVAASFVLVLAALAASSAFSIANRPAANALSMRDRRLAWASIGLAGSYALAMGGQLFLVSYSSDHAASGGFIAGVSVVAAGGAFAAGAGSIGAVAFYNSQRPQRQTWIGRLPPRDALLGLATAVFAMAFLLMGFGVILQATAGRGLDSTRIVLLWLTGVSSFGNAIASAFAAVGFSGLQPRFRKSS